MALELAEIARRYGAAFQDHYRLQPSQRRALRDIERCQTAALGGQTLVCPECEHVAYRYHSCRNRHCPKCQHALAEAWLSEQQACLLNVPYVLLTFTLPAALRPLARTSPRRIYDLLFRAAAQATLQLAQDLRYIGGLVGMLGVLHTWTRDMRYHPHVHFLIPAGGLAAGGVTWRPARRDFFLPVKALSRLFRAAFQRALRRDALYAQIPEQVWTDPWVVHSKGVGTGERALRYLAPYVFRVAISNRRLVKLENGQVTFRYVDSKTRQTRSYTLPAEAFLRRFVQHILPKGFVKVRYYGLFAPRFRQTLLAVQRRLTEEDGTDDAPKQPTERTATPVEPERCPVCGGVVQVRPLLRALARCPPG